ncbi:MULTISPECIES: UDP-glucose dehydrogenase family protein [Geobacillus]|jgi:UDPglucose 6-dehydrogenase|uniref:UDP-glucose 6-dehydrogenase n=1 Tax=Geobacillus thermodenitrificans TaxID=33940 RepID=A0ABY9QDR7_GEOTD|nr:MULTISPECIES: UDP-glucose/GDP-mannose dehydrogenase family protein [Geobacillus]ARA97464.1 UDP-glucose 6-dehydrogenase [Geobacillus thermodenitrificans]ARP41833.1 UDP-glucose 6-dehydrogenase [Geobacillus thermodenitrificans]ATO36789.1 UDP-glucose 6-dehydrogenase [Geobacillus thermodenitrificans]MEC5189025.1 UDPglucose 6-dehydrogenase [Geobacillus thermodenitrificans]MED4916687.1 UDP-glucose/GDP-mannose dehydrogenase family protein [Geobacillus thermodenitrificans]
MNICIIGAGYVGLTTAAVLAELGHEVHCIDHDERKIHLLNNGEVPFYEPGLEELITKNCNYLTFSGRWDYIKRAAVIVICVGTPPRPDGSADLRYIEAVLDRLAATIESYKTIVTKSTVPPGTNEWMRAELIRKGVAPHLFRIVSNPEFLREGSAVYDMFHPDKIVVGLEPDDDRSLAVVQTMYAGINAPYVTTSLTGAELIKYAANAFLATKISFINEMARICDAFAVDINDVARGIGFDPRIGPHFLQAGLGYGGSCFPKDVKALEHAARSRDVEPRLLQAVQSVNATQIDVCLNKLNKELAPLNGKKIAVLGIAFKPNTDDTRFSPAEALIRQLSGSGCTVAAYDPKATLTAPLANVIQVQSVHEAIQDADALIIATDWDEFRTLDWSEVKAAMNGTLVFDGRNCLDRRAVEQSGLRYVGVGRP